MKASGSDGNFTGAVRLQPTNVQGHVTWLWAFAGCGRCGSKTRIKGRAGQRVRNWNCGTCNAYNEPTSPFSFVSVN